MYISSFHLSPQCQHEVLALSLGRSTYMKGRGFIHVLKSLIYLLNSNAEFHGRVIYVFKTYYFFYPISGNSSCFPMQAWKIHNLSCFCFGTQVPNRGEGKSGNFCRSLKNQRKDWITFRYHRVQMLCSAKGLQPSKCVLFKHFYFPLCPLAKNSEYIKNWNWSNASRCLLDWFRVEKLVLICYTESTKNCWQWERAISIFNISLS